MLSPCINKMRLAKKVLKVLHQKFAELELHEIVQFPSAIFLKISMLVLCDLFWMRDIFQYSVIIVRNRQQANLLF